MIRLSQHSRASHKNGRSFLTGDKLKSQPMSQGSCRKAAGGWGLQVPEFSFLGHKIGLCANYCIWGISTPILGVSTFEQSQPQAMLWVEVMCQEQPIFVSSCISCGIKAGEETGQYVSCFCQPCSDSWSALAAGQRSL